MSKFKKTFYFREEHSLLSCDFENQNNVLVIYRIGTPSLPEQYVQILFLCRTTATFIFELTKMITCSKITHSTNNYRLFVAVTFVCFRTLRLSFISYSGNIVDIYENAS